MAPLELNSISLANDFREYSLPIVHLILLIEFVLFILWCLGHQNDLLFGLISAFGFGGHERLHSVLLWPVRAFVCGSWNLRGASSVVLAGCLSLLSKLRGLVFFGVFSASLSFLSGPV